MKKVVGLALFLGLLTACSRSPIESQSASATPQPHVPSPIPAFTFTPSLTAAASLTDQISIEHADIVYYDITGSTADELRVSMNELRPKDPYDDNQPVDAYTDWYVAWNWPGYGTDSCDLSVANVTYSIKVIVPRWKAPADASPELLTKWEKYIQSLILHEKGHVDNVVNNYLSVKTAIQGTTCLGAEAEAQKALEALWKFDSSYDDETGHGESQGVVFP